MKREERRHVEEALINKHDRIKVRYHLNKAIGNDIDGIKEVNGHLFRHGETRCCVQMCEINDRELAKEYKCPRTIVEHKE